MKPSSFSFAKACAITSFISIAVYAFAILFGPEVFYFPVIVFFALSFGVTFTSFVILGAMVLFAEGTSVISRKQFIGIFFLLGSFAAVAFANMFVEFSNKLDPWSYYVAGLLFLLALIFSYFGLLHVFKPPVSYRVKGTKLQAY